MDNRENGGTTEVTEEELVSEPHVESSDVDYEKLRQIMQISTKNTLEHLDKLIQSSSTRSNKRTYLELFRALIEENAKSSESIIYLFEYVIDLRTSIFLLSAEVEKGSGKTAKDVKKIKTKLDALLNSPAMIEIGKVLQKIQKITEERKKTPDRNPAKDYMR